MTDSLQAGNGLKQGNRLAPNFFNTALEYVIRKLWVGVKSTILYQSVQQLIRYADVTDINRRTKGAVSEVQQQLKETLKR